MKKKSQLPLMVALGITLFIGALIVALLGFDAVDASHIGVKVRFGEILGTMQAGIQWTGIFTHVEEYDLRTRKLAVEMVGDNSAVDKTGQAVYGTIHVNFRVKPNAETVLELYKNIGSDAVIVDRLNIDPIVREGFKQTTSHYDALEILNKREDVKREAIDRIRENFPNDYYELQDVVITNIDFSQAFNDAIEAKKTSEQNAIKEKNNLEVVKFQQAQEIEKYKAEAEKNRLQYTAETEKLRLQKEQLTPELIQKAMIEKWSGNYPQYLIITGDQAQSFIPFLNLPTTPEAK